jgi:hypothetical protein
MIGFTIIPISWLIRGVTAMALVQLPLCHMDVEWSDHETSSTPTTTIHRLMHLTWRMCGQHADRLKWYMQCQAWQEHDRCTKMRTTAIRRFPFPRQLTSRCVERKYERKSGVIAFIWCHRSARSGAQGPLAQTGRL